MADASPGDGGRDGMLGPRPDAASTDSAPDGGEGPPASGFPVFVAQGVLGRTMVSCDDGQSWVHDQSRDDAFVCGDCDHHAWAATGLAAADGWVYTGWGHGAPGMIRRSRDGFTWQDVKTGIETIGLAAGRHIVVASPWGGDKPYVSTNDGMTFETATTLPLKVWPRRIIYIPRGPRGRFLLAARVGAGLEAQYTDDAGSSWPPAEALPPACEPARLGYGKGIVIMIGAGGGVCRSLDQGATWQVSAGSAKGVETDPLFTRDKFMAWGFPSGQTVFESTDGDHWTTRKQSASINAAAIGESGTLVAAFERYGRQSFSRSIDGGLTWTTLAEGKFAKGHPIKAIVFARLAKNPCP